MPKRACPSAAIACVPEEIINPDGEEETVMLLSKYCPYDRQPSTIANICGAFRQPACMANVAGIIVDTTNSFGRLRELFSIHGNVAITHGKATFMGARGLGSLERLASTLQLDDSRSTVHMAVMCARAGKRLQVRAGGMLESRLLSHHRGNIVVTGKGLDITNTVNMSVYRFCEPHDGVPLQSDTQPTFAMKRRFRPDKNVWAVTGRGTVHIRFSWAGVEWTSDCEEACLALCDRVVTRCIAPSAHSPGGKGGSSSTAPPPLP
jgi:hypothetical protein